MKTFNVQYCYVMESYIIYLRLRLTNFAMLNVFEMRQCASPLPNKATTIR